MNFMLDINGTLLNDEWKAEEFAKEAIIYLFENNIKFCLLSNTTTQPRQFILDKMISLGFSEKLKIEQIITPALIATNYIESNNLNILPFVTTDLLEYDLKNLKYDEKKELDGILMGDMDYTYEKLDEILNFLINNENSKLYSLAENRIYKKDGKFKIDLGGWVKCVEYSSNKKLYKNFGKPTSLIFQYAAEKLDTKLYKCYVIGDDVESDINGALKLGATGILVKTGKYIKGDENKMKDRTKLSTNNVLDAIKLIHRDHDILF